MFYQYLCQNNQMAYIQCIILIKVKFKYFAWVIYIKYE
jgi:hypothetical protein